LDLPGFTHAPFSPSLVCPFFFASSFFAFMSSLSEMISQFHYFQTEIQAIYLQFPPILLCFLCLHSPPLPSLTLPQEVAVSSSSWLAQKLETKIRELG
jgi:hypothetical protein